VRDAAELRVKETDRIAKVAAELGKMGAQTEFLLIIAAVTSTATKTAPICGCAACKSPTEDLRAQIAWLRGAFDSAETLLRQAVAQANPSERAASLRDWEQLFTEHPDLSGKEALRTILSE